MVKLNDYKQNKSNLLHCFNLQYPNKTALFKNSL